MFASEYWLFRVFKNLLWRYLYSLVSSVVNTVVIYVFYYNFFVFFVFFNSCTDTLVSNANKHDINFNHYLSVFMSEDMTIKMVIRIT